MTLTLNSTNLALDRYAKRFPSMRVVAAASLSGRAEIEGLLKNGIQLIDHLHAQLLELMEIYNPDCKGDAVSLGELLESHLDGRSEEEYGNYVFYPWCQSIVHVLPEEEFIEVRTNRNREKVTREQIAAFRKKKVAIIGLSVGQAIAKTIALESLVGELRLADFDDLELSNMNRIGASLTQQGLPKVEITKRAINELDPYIKVVVQPAGITSENLTTFLCEGGNVDVLIDECDSIAIKIRAREKARELGIPVLMETSDRGMIDIERFDLHPQSHLLDKLTVTADQVESDPLSRTKALSELIDLDSLSEGMKTSMPLIGKTLLSWPQLASDVTLGGATIAICCRLLFTSNLLLTGRRYIDVNKLITA